MTSLSAYQLYWYDIADRDCRQSVNGGVDQFVFESAADVVADVASISRVKTVHDALQLASGGDADAAAKVAVAVVALLGGNLLALGQWRWFLGFVAFGVTVAILELRAAAEGATVVLLAIFVDTLWRGLVSPEWVAIVALVLLIALVIHVSILSIVQADPRSYVLLKDLGQESLSSSVVIRNSCCMDIKILVFNHRDAVRMIPVGGLFGGQVLPRGDSTSIGDAPPYVVKVYGGFGQELGQYLTAEGTYSFRATAPPLVLSCSEKPRFANSTDAPVVVCLCGLTHWTSSVHQPFAPLLARIAWRGQRVAADEEVPIPTPCVLRVYTGCVGLARGVRGGIWEEASCVVRAGEQVEYCGSITWRRVSSKATRRSVSQILGIH